MNQNSKSRSLCLYTRIAAAAGIFVLVCRSWMQMVYASTGVEEEQIKKQIDTILNSAEFSPKSRGKNLLEVLGDLLRNVVEWARERVQQLLPGRTFSLPRTGFTPRSLLVLQWVSVLVIMAFLCWITYIIMRNVRSSRRIRMREDAELLSTLRDYSETERRAEAFAREGNYTQAVRFLFISLLLQMNEKEYLRIDKAKTNRQYLQEMKINEYPQWRKVEDFIYLFSRCWYGKIDAAAQEFAYWREQYPQLTAVMSRSSGEKIVNRMDNQ